MWQPRPFQVERFLYNHASFGLPMMPFAINLPPHLWSLKVVPGCSLGRDSGSLFYMGTDPVNAHGARMGKITTKKSSLAGSRDCSVQEAVPGL